MKYNKNGYTVLTLNRSTLKIMFLDYWNNFLTISRFAEYYNISVARANRIILLGKIYHNLDVGIPNDYV